MEIYKNWGKIAELEDDRNFLKLRLMTEDDPEKLAEFKKLYPELFCIDPINICFPKSSIIQKSKEEYLNRKNLISDYSDISEEKSEWMKQDNLENAEYWSKKNWLHSLSVLGVPTVVISFNYSYFWTESECVGFYEFIKLIKDTEYLIEDGIFAGEYKIILFGKEMVVVEFDTMEEYIVLALLEHIDMNS